VSARRRPAIALALLLTFLAAPGRGEKFFDARVVAVIDGDTLEVRAEGQKLRVRIFGIDTPERGQPWSRKAREALARRLSGKEVRINEVETDDYGRLVGEVYADDVCVGCELVREGHAWVYRRYTQDPVLLALEAEARAQRRGLWALPEAERTPPWEWRHGGKATEQAPEGAQPEASASRCGSKRYCREMQSCEEALLHLRTCGLTHLDEDGDGVPCESLCRRK
jgi:endonuclease YncB( thermonuclease family)